MRFRRKSSTEELDQIETPGLDDVPAAPAGPYDAEEVDDLDSRVDLGSLLLLPNPTKELRIQVDEASGVVQAVLLTGTDGALELRAFAASRDGDLWGEVRPAIAADMARRGGVATARDGAFGPELYCELTTTLEDGRTGTQLSRIIGINGSRWMLRATLIGEPARSTEGAEEWENLIRQVAVRRGAGALPPGEALPLELPQQARRIDE